MEYPMSTVIATRVLTRTRQPDGFVETYTVQIGIPIQTPANDPIGGWYSTMQFSADPNQEVYVAYGDDSVQALIHALYLPGVLLHSLPYASEIDMSSSPTFGFPPMPV